MNRLNSLLASAIAMLSIFSCGKNDTIIFEHEKQQFDVKEGKILIELKVPQSTSGIESFSIKGPFNESTASEYKWQFVQSPMTRLKWGLYIDPKDFDEGKTLNDGFTVVSSLKGRACTDNGIIEIYRTAAVAGERVDIQVQRFEDDFQSDFPLPEEGQIILGAYLPDETPENSDIYIYGEVNGWEAMSAPEKWKMTLCGESKGYWVFNETDFSDAVTLEDDFRLAIVRDGYDWTHFQNNDDGTDSEGAPFRLILNETQKSYSIEVKAWRNMADLSRPQWPVPPADKIQLRLTLPWYTPSNLNVYIIGALTGWTSGFNSDRNKWITTPLQENSCLRYINIDPANMSGGNTLANDWKVVLCASDASNVYYYQGNSDGSATEDGVYRIPGEQTVGNFYEHTVLHWTHSEELGNNMEQ